MDNDGPRFSCWLHILSRVGLGGDVCSPLKLKCKGGGGCRGGNMKFELFCTVEIRIVATAAGIMHIEQKYKTNILQILAVYIFRIRLKSLRNLAWAVMFLSRVLEVPASDLALDDFFLLRFLLVFFISSRQIPREYLQIGYNRFLLYHFQFIIHYSSYHWALYSKPSIIWINWIEVIRIKK
jgi:hypothetical protein